MCAAALPLRLLRLIKDWQTMPLTTAMVTQPHTQASRGTEREIHQEYINMTTIIMGHTSPDFCLPCLCLRSDTCTICIKIDSSDKSSQPATKPHTAASDQMYNREGGSAPMTDWEPVRMDGLCGQTDRQTYRTDRESVLHISCYNGHGQ